MKHSVHQQRRAHHALSDMKSSRRRARIWSYVRVLPAASLLVVGIRLALLVLPSGSVVRLVRAVGARPVRSNTGSNDQNALLGCIRRVSRLVPGATCLTQAVAGQILLQQNGYHATLRLGVRTGAQGFAAHAWLEQDGRKILGQAAARGMVVLPDLNSRL